MIIKARIFGGNNCPKCIEAIILLYKEGIKIHYTDAFSTDKEIQNICDKYNIVELPHIQFKDENDKIISTHIGKINKKELLEYIAKGKDGIKQISTSSS